MPQPTENYGFKKALGNENVTREAYNENLDLIDIRIKDIEASNEEHSDDPSAHGIGADSYIAKTSRADHKPSYNDLQDKPLQMGRFIYFGRGCSWQNKKWHVFKSR